MDDPEDTDDPVRRADAKGDRRAGRRPPAGRRSPDAAEGANGQASAAAALRLHRPIRPGTGRTTAETAFDIWLSRSLHAMFDRYKDEAVPAEWLRLIEEDRARRRSG